MDEQREVMNIQQAADYLGVSVDALYGYVGKKVVPAFKLGNRWKFHRKTLDKWIENISKHNSDQIKRK